MDFVSFHTADLNDIGLEYLAEGGTQDASVERETPSLLKSYKSKSETKGIDTQCVGAEDSTYYDVDCIRPSKRRRKMSAHINEAPIVYSRVQTRSSTKGESRRGGTPRENDNVSLYVSNTAEKNLPWVQDTDQPEREVGPSEDNPLLKTREASLGSHTKNIHDAHTYDAMRMPPPCTPKKQRLKEIPSSQSPPATPWSATSRATCKSAMQSPLQQKSANVARPFLPPSRYKIHPPPMLEIQDTFDEDDKENRGTSSIGPTPAKHSLRISSPLCRLPLQQTRSASGRNGATIPDLAVIASAAPSSTVAASEIGDSDASDELIEGFDSKHSELQVEMTLPIGEESPSTSSSVTDIEEELLIPTASASGKTAEPRALKVLQIPRLDPGIDKELGQSKTFPNSTPLVKKITPSSISLNPRTPRRTYREPGLNEDTKQLHLEPSEVAQPTVLDRISNSISEFPGGDQSSPSPIRTRKEIPDFPTSSFTQRLVDTDLAKDATPVVDLGVLVGWRRLTESQRLADSLLRDDLNVENTWELDTAADTQRSP